VSVGPSPELLLGKSTAHERVVNFGPVLTRASRGVGNLKLNFENTSVEISKAPAWRDRGGRERQCGQFRERQLRVLVVWELRHGQIEYGQSGER